MAGGAYDPETWHDFFIAAVWAGELDRARELTWLSERQPHPPRWMEWVPAWVRGLAAEAAGTIEQARLHLDVAVRKLGTSAPVHLV